MEVGSNDQLDPRRSCALRRLARSEAHSRCAVQPRAPKLPQSTTAIWLIDCGLIPLHF